MRQLIACSLTVLIFANAAHASSVTWLSDGRSLNVLSNFGEDSASSDFGTTTWDTTISAGNAFASQNTTIDNTSIFGGTSEVYMDGVTDWFSASNFVVDFRVAGGGTSLVLTGDYGGYGEFGTPGGSAGFTLRQGDTLIYQASGDVIDYFGFLADGDYRIFVNASIGPGGFNGGGADFDFTGEFGTSAVTFVPIPAAVWLFGSALAGLGWMRRKQTASV